MITVITAEFRIRPLQEQKVNTLMISLRGKPDPYNTDEYRPIRKYISGSLGGIPGEGVSYLGGACTYSKDGRLFAFDAISFPNPLSAEGRKNLQSTYWRSFEKIEQNGYCGELLSARISQYPYKADDEKAIENLLRKLLMSHPVAKHTGFIQLDVFVLNKDKGTNNRITILGGARIAFPDPSWIEGLEDKDLTGYDATENLTRMLRKKLGPDVRSHSAISIEEGTKDGICIFRYFHAFSYAPGIGIKAASKTIQNAYGYACSTLKENAPCPIAFSDLMLTADALKDAGKRITAMDIHEACRKAAVPCGGITDEQAKMLAEASGKARKPGREWKTEEYDFEHKAFVMDEEMTNG